MWNFGSLRKKVRARAVLGYPKVYLDRISLKRHLSTGGQVFAFNPTNAHVLCTDRWSFSRL